MATMKDVAALANVSTATVSHVLSGKKTVSGAAYARVMEAIALTNYTPNITAKRLRTNQTQTIGVVVEDIRAFPVADIVDGISEYLETQGYQLILSNLRLLEKLYNQYEHLTRYQTAVNEGVRLMVDAQVDGIIYVAMHDRRIDNIIAPINKPFVIAYAYSSNKHEPSITYDNEQSARQMTQMLIDNGHKRIAIISGHASSAASKFRLRGYREAMDGAGLSVPPEYIRWGDWEFDSGRNETLKLLDMPMRPTAIFAMNDLMAAGCYAAIQQRGLRVPEDVSVGGFDNREVTAYLVPPLTTLALPHKQIGITASRLLVEKIADPQTEISNTLLPCELISRSSVRRIGE